MRNVTINLRLRSLTNNQWQLLFIRASLDKHTSNGGYFISMSSANLEGELQIGFANTQGDVWHMTRDSQSRWSGAREVRRIVLGGFNRSVDEDTCVSPQGELEFFLYTTSGGDVWQINQSAIDGVGVKKLTV